VELKDLRTAAENHLHARYPDFNPSSAEVTASVLRDNATNLVTFSYFWNFGLPVYYVRFDPKGRVTYSTNRIATESEKLITK
jgi:hypothetical protein